MPRGAPASIGNGKERVVRCHRLHWKRKRASCEVPPAPGQPRDPRCTNLTKSLQRDVPPQAGMCPLHVAVMEAKPSMAPSKTKAAGRASRLVGLSLERPLGGLACGCPGL